jgi:L-asparaginase II
LIIVPVHSLVVEARRGRTVESVHRVAVALVDRDGRRVATSGDPAFPVFMRSAAKPFQAMPIVADGAAERFAMSDEELALACASHNSERRQVALARGLLERIGCAEADLACGPHRALALELGVLLPGERPPADLEPPGHLASNCSGKHAGMLALARAHGWPVAGYHRPDHPVQQRCREEVARWTGLPAAAIAEAVDGCGVVTFQVPLERMAAAFARFGVAGDGAAPRVRAAMLAHPDLVAGRHRLCTEVMRAYPGEIVAKVGADGVYGAALPRRGVGLAIKIEDGDARANMAALVAVLEQLGFERRPSLERFARFPITNTRNEPVGAVEVAGALSFE